LRLAARSQQRSRRQHYCCIKHIRLIIFPARLNLFKPGAAHVDFNDYSDHIGLAGNRSHPELAAQPELGLRSQWRARPGRADHRRVAPSRKDLTGRRNRVFEIFPIIGSIQTAVGNTGCRADCGFRDVDVRATRLLP
jgi:hypothetical protein